MGSGNAESYHIYEVESMAMKHFGPTKLDATLIPKIARQWGTPVYLHDQEFIENSCEQLLNMPNAYGLHVRYAM